MSGSAFAAIAEGYANRRPPIHARVIELLKERLGLNNAFEHAVDVGCGSGLSTRALAAIARQRIGIEPVESMLQWAPKVAPGAAFVAGAAESLPIRSGSVDLITAAGCLNYADIDAFFSEAARVLCGDGMVAVYDFSPGRLFGDSRELADWFDSFMLRYPRAPDGAKTLTPDSFHVAGFDAAFRELFEIALPYDRASYADYILTETNVAHAVQTGTPEADIRSWCLETLAALFGHRSREVLFRGYLVCLRRL